MANEQSERDAKIFRDFMEGEKKLLEIRQRFLQGRGANAGTAVLQDFFMREQAQHRALVNKVLDANPSRNVFKSEMEEERDGGKSEFSQPLAQYITGGLSDKFRLESETKDQVNDVTRNLEVQVKMRSQEAARLAGAAQAERDSGSFTQQKDTLLTEASRLTQAEREEYPSEPTSRASAKLSPSQQLNLDRQRTLANNKPKENRLLGAFKNAVAKIADVRNNAKQKIEDRFNLAEKRIARAEAKEVKREQRELDRGLNKVFKQQEKKEQKIQAAVAKWQGGKVEGAKQEADKKIDNAAIHAVARVAEIPTTSPESASVIDNVYAEIMKQGVQPTSEDAKQHAGTGQRILDEQTEKELREFVGSEYDTSASSVVKSDNEPALMLSEVEYPEDLKAWMADSENVVTDLQEEAKETVSAFGETATNVEKVSDVEFAAIPSAQEIDKFFNDIQPVSETAAPAIQNEEAQLDALVHTLPGPEREAMKHSVADPQQTAHNAQQQAAQQQTQQSLNKTPPAVPSRPSPAALAAAVKSRPGR
jgi:hypothetical protein